MITKQPDGSYRLKYSLTCTTRGDVSPGSEMRCGAGSIGGAVSVIGAGKASRTSRPSFPTAKVNLHPISLKINLTPIYFPLVMNGKCLER